ncbi:hypothetical protein SAZ_02455 [Streptomyces noursei ZPM]|nr:hypothetical protein SAZ_02455 [Streptomyces noursei ZPM]
MRGGRPAGGARQPAALVAGGVAEGRRRRRVGVRGPGQFVQQQFEGPGVEDEVGHHDQQPCFVGRRPFGEGHSQQRAVRQVERFGGQLAGERVGGVGPRTAGADQARRQFLPYDRTDARAVRRGAVEGGAQCLVSGREAAHPLGEQVEVDGGAGEVDCLADHVHRAFAHPLPGAPQAQLTWRQLLRGAAGFGQSGAEQGSLFGGEGGEAGREVGGHA